MNVLADIKPDSRLDELWFKMPSFISCTSRHFGGQHNQRTGLAISPGSPSKLDYLQESRRHDTVAAAFYPSPGADDGYDISDYAPSIPISGRYQDFRRFMLEAKRR